jgi:hypothetical protein
MTRSMTRATLALAALAATALAGCDRSPTEARPDAPVALAFQALLGAGNEMVAMIAVEVTGQGIVIPIVANFPVEDGAASGTIQVPAGNARTFTARGFDTEGHITHEGAVTQDVRPGGPPVLIALLPRGVGVPIEVTVSSYLVAIDPVATELNVGQTLAFAATVTDGAGAPTPFDAAALTWGSTNPALAQVDGDGVVTGLYPGTVRIVVSYEGVAAEAELVVIDDDLLSLSLVAPAEVEPGAPFDLVLTVRNRGDETVPELVAGVIVPALAVAMDDGCLNMDVLDDITSQVTGSYFFCMPPGPLAPGEEVTWTVTARTRLVQGTGLAVEAAIQTWQGPEDPYPDNNSAAAQVWVTDGRIVFASDRHGGPDLSLYTVRPDGTGLTRLTDHSLDDHSPAWSPDRSRVAFIRGPTGGDGTLWLINADGSGETELAVPATHGVTWAPDGDRIAVSGWSPADQDYRILVVDVATETYSVLTPKTDLTRPDWSPDGTELLVTFEHMFAYRVTLDGAASSLNMVFEGSCFPVGPAYSFRWAPAGDAIAYTYHWPFDTTEPEAIHGIWKGPPHPDWGYLCGNEFTIWDTILADDDTRFRWPAWSPDGQRLALTRQATTPGAPEQLMVVNADGSAPVILGGSANDTHPHW